MNIILFVIAVILGAIVFIVGFIFNIIRAWKVEDAWDFFLNLLKEIGKTFYSLPLLLACWIDGLGNVVGGNFFKYFFIKKEYWHLVFFGKSGFTISQSSGHSLKYNYFNEKGYKLSDKIDAVFGKGHCKLAYEKYVYINKFNKPKTEITNKLLGF